MLRLLIELQRQLRNEKLSRKRLEDLQRRKLKRLLQHARDHVPYYRDRFDKAGVDPRRVQGPGDLPMLPIIRRDQVMAEPAARRVAAGLSPARLLRQRTSGSSGDALDVYFSAEESRQRRATYFRALLAIGFRPDDRMAFLGYMGSARRPWHEKLGYYRTLMLQPTLHLEQQLRGLEAFRPTFLRFHPLSLQALADHAGRPIGEWLHAKRLAYGAETLSRSLRRRIEREHGGELFNLYGAVEFGRLAWECPTHAGLHVNADQFIVEAIRDGEPVPPGEPGTAVVTALNAFASPFIRYELGDIIRFSGTPCSCGSSFPLIGHPEGRVKDMMRLPSGRRCSPLASEWWIFEAVAPSKFRIIQHRPDFIEVLIEGPSVPPSEVQMRLEQEQGKYLEEAMPFEARVVRDLPMEGRKFKVFESRIPQD